MKPNSIFRALRYRNYRLFFIGQGISLVGTWMQLVAIGWLVYRMTNSVFLLGLTVFAGQIPVCILGPFAGVIADRVNRHRLLIFTQALSLVQALVLAILTIADVITVPQILILSLCLGCINSFDMPLRQSFVFELVERKENLGNAIALNSFIFNFARLLGPMIAGIVVALFGEGICFFINAITFSAVLISLLTMRIKPRNIEKDRPHILADLKEGMGYILGFVPIRMILMLLAVMSLTGMSYIVLMPVFARDVLRGGPQTLGYLMSAAGIGALIATVCLASRKTILGLGRLIPISALLFALALVMFAISHELWISLLLLCLVGFGMMLNMAASNTILQTIADDDKRGRVMSFYVVAFIGMAPFGSLIAGSLAARIGVSNTLIILGGICILSATVFAGKLPALREAIHPVYRKMGIIPEVAKGMNVASELVVPPEE